MSKVEVLEVCGIPSGFPFFESGVTLSQHYRAGKTLQAKEDIMAKIHHLFVIDPIENLNLKTGLQPACRPRTVQYWPSSLRQHPRSIRVVESRTLRCGLCSGAGFS